MLTWQLARDQFGMMMRKHMWRFRAEPPTISLAVAIAFCLATFIVPAIVPDGTSGMSTPSMTVDAAAFPRGGYVAVGPDHGGAQAWLANNTAPIGYELLPIADPLAQNLTAAVVPLLSALVDAPGAYAAFATRQSAEVALFEGGGLLFNSSYTNAIPAYTRLMEQSLVGAIDPSLTASRWWSATYEMLPYRVDPAKSHHFATSAILKLVLPPLTINVPLVVLTLMPVISIAVDRESKCKHQVMLMGLDIRIYWLSCMRHAASSTHHPVPPTRLHGQLLGDRDSARRPAPCQCASHAD